MGRNCTMGRRHSYGGHRTVGRKLHQRTDRTLGCGFHQWADCALGRYRTVGRKFDLPLLTFNISPALAQPY